jgi:hypothetical protein
LLGDKLDEVTRKVSHTGDADTQINA